MARRKQCPVLPWRRRAARRMAEAAADAVIERVTGSMAEFAVRSSHRPEAPQLDLGSTSKAPNESLERTRPLYVAPAIDPANVLSIDASEPGVCLLKRSAGASE